MRVITLESLPYVLRYLPHIVEKSVNKFVKPLGFYYKDRLTRLFYWLFTQGDPDLCVFEDIYLSWNTKVPAVTFLHAVWSDNLQAFNLSKDQIQRLIHKESKTIAVIAHSILTVSYPYRDYLCNVHFFRSPLAKKIDVVELGLDMSRFPNKNAASNHLALIYCGALEARKNAAFMLDIFEILYEVAPQARLTIIGDGPERENLERRARVRGLPITFKGRQPQEVVISELLYHSIYLHTSVKESFSFSLLEAKLCGLTTFALETLEVPKGFIDFGFKSFDAHAWARQILRIESSSNKISLSEFSVQRMTDKILKFSGVQQE